MAKTFLDDKESLQAIVEQLPDDELEIYQGMGALTLTSVFPNRVFVLYTLQGGKPRNIELITIGDIGLTRREGPTLQMSAPGKHLELGVLPQRWFGRDIFFQVPQNFVLKWLGKRVEGGKSSVTFVASSAVLVRSRSRPHMKIDGETYAETLNDFREKYPGDTPRY
jgi:hypothetical protein